MNRTAPIARAARRPARHSALYTGHVTHARRGTPSHAFTHDLYMLYLDLDELGQLGLWPALGVETPGLLSFRRADYRGETAVPLDELIKNEVETATGYRPKGAVRLLTHVRSLRRAFNPVSFYYCFDPDERLVAVLAEITNTPWGERHAYVLPGSGDNASMSFDKAFHVSPFLPMDHRYHWQLGTPGARLTAELQSTSDGIEVFRARLSLGRRELTRWSLAWAALCMPLMSLRVLFLIYWQALRLWLKRAPVFDHPKTLLLDPRVTRKSIKSQA